MGARGYEISLLVFNSTSHSLAALTREAFEVNTRREFSYPHVPMYYSLFNKLLRETHK